MEFTTVWIRDERIWKMSTPSTKLHYDFTPASRSIFIVNIQCSRQQLYIANNLGQVQPQLLCPCILNYLKIKITNRKTGRTRTFDCPYQSITGPNDVTFCRDMLRKGAVTQGTHKISCIFNFTCCEIHQDQGD